MSRGEPRASSRRRSRGQGLVEFALVFPILMLLLIAVFDLGRLVFAYNDITNAARSGARVAIVDQTANVARTATINQATSLGLKPADVTVDYLKDDLSGPCPSPKQLGCVAHVKVQVRLAAPSHRSSGASSGPSPSRPNPACPSSVSIHDRLPTGKVSRRPRGVRPMLTADRRTRQAGQALVLMVLAMVAVISGMALIIDGGNAWAQQRITQSGNDAASEAGTIVLARFNAGQTAPALGWDAEVLAAINASATSNGVTVPVDTGTGRRAAYYTDICGTLLRPDGTKATTTRMPRSSGAAPCRPTTIPTPTARAAPSAPWPASRCQPGECSTRTSRASWESDIHLDHERHRGHGTAPGLLRRPGLHRLAGHRPGHGRDLRE